jgi:hypothetical protein
MSDEKGLPALRSKRKRPGFIGFAFSWSVAAMCWLNEALERISMVLV